MEVQVVLEEVEEEGVLVMVAVLEVEVEEEGRFGLKEEDQVL